MSGHSKWSSIKRQKGVADVKRGQTFTKFSKAIIIAVHEGGGVGDPNQNFKLRLIIEKARSINMPKENIERAIEKGMGVGAKGEGLAEVVCEGFGPGGVALIVEAATDNTKRTTSEIKNIFDRSGGSFGQPGSVSYQFETKGFIIVKKDTKSFEDIFLLAIDAGALDVEENGNEVFLYTKPEELFKVKEALTSQGLIVLEYEQTRKPTITVAVTDKETVAKILNFIERLENLDDVQKVYANCDIPDNLIE